MTPTFDTKDPRETVVLTFDASADLDSGETLTSVTDTEVTVNRGTDKNASSVVSDPQINVSTLSVGGATIQTAHGI